jgi:steroid 5-alpha reductase family enzyme
MGFDPATGAMALGLICTLAFITWLVSLSRKDVSIVDAMWPVFIGSAGVWYFVSAPPPHAVGIIALALLVIWAVRLCVHIAVRNHGQPEDRRYRKIRANNQPHFEYKSLYIVFGLQAALAWIVALPFMAIAGATGASALSWPISAFGLLVAASGIVFEAIADRQLERFKENPDNHRRVLDTGLWRYSRHPNYFGECCVWWGFGLAALAVGAWWALASPLLMTWLLLKVSGVVMLESDIGERRPEYARYLRETNAFVPGKPRLEAAASRVQST